MAYTLSIKNGEQRPVSSDPKFQFEGAHGYPTGNVCFWCLGKTDPPGFSISKRVSLPATHELREGMPVGESTLSPDERQVHSCRS